VTAPCILKEHLSKHNVEEGHNCGREMRVIIMLNNHISEPYILPNALYQGLSIRGILKSIQQFKRILKCNILVMTADWYQL